MKENHGEPDRQMRDAIAVKLADYRNGQTSLAQLVNDLDAIWNDLPLSEWRDEFRGHWWTLEQVYAVGIDRGELAELPVDAQSDINEAVAGIESLLQRSAE
jgi:hypothetical protein